MEQDYHYYNEIFKSEIKPLAYIDVDLLEKNIKNIITRAGTKKIRVASKSVRSISILKKIMASNNIFHGIMSFTGSESAYLSKNGFDNILVAYPIWDEHEIRAVCEELKKNKNITLMVDSKEHIDRLNLLGEKFTANIPICIDIDMSARYPGLNFGVYRSSIREQKQVLTLCTDIAKAKNLTLDGIMGYEAEIAGVPDFSPANGFIKNTLIAVLKNRAKKTIRKRRTMVVKAIQEAGYTLKFVNGGGTGSVESTREEENVTEVTVGSGFFASKLFDYYRHFRHLPAAGFAIEIIRLPETNIYTCHGGGYIASGAIGKDKQPYPYLPAGARLLTNEGAGEVQTPIFYKGKEKLTIGNTIFLRHAKAGELCEHFNELVVVSHGKIVERVKTYRGDGQHFL